MSIYIDADHLKKSVLDIRPANSYNYSEVKILRYVINFSAAVHCRSQQEILHHGE